MDIGNDGDRRCNTGKQFIQFRFVQQLCGCSTKQYQRCLLTGTPDGGHDIVRQGREHSQAGQPETRGTHFIPDVDRYGQGSYFSPRLQDAVQDQDRNDQTINGDTLGKSHEYQGAAQQFGFLRDGADGGAADTGNGNAGAQR